MNLELKNIQTLKKEFDEISSSDNLAFIRFFENNLTSIESIDPDSDEAHYNTKLRLNCEYGMSLSGSGKHVKAVEVLGKAIPMFEKAPNQDQSKLRNSSYFEYLLWSYVISLYETKALNEPITLLKRLVEYKPENEKYGSWLKALKAQKISKLRKPLWVLLFLSLVGELFFFERIDAIFEFNLSLIGGFLLLVVVTFEFYLYMTTRRK